MKISPQSQKQIQLVILTISIYEQVINNLLLIYYTTAEAVCLTVTFVRLAIHSAVVKWIMRNELLSRRRDEHQSHAGYHARNTHTYTTSESFSSLHPCLPRLWEVTRLSSECKPCPSDIEFHAWLTWASTPKAWLFYQVVAGKPY